MTRYLDENSGKQIVIETNKKFTAVESSLSEKANLLPVNITTYGAIGDGVTDCTSALNLSISSTDTDISSRVTNKELVADINANGIADGWIEYTGAGITGNLTIDNGQKVAVTGSTSVGGKAVYQDILANVGEQISFNIAYKSIVSTGAFSPALTITAVNDNGDTVQFFGGVWLTNSSVDTVYQSSKFTIPSGATKLRVHLMAYANAIGDTGTVTYHDISFSMNTVNTNKAIKFTQNSTNNAIYYFATNPSLTGLKIACDKGVVLSVPSTNNISFKTVEFLNDISIYSRDRDNTGIQYKNDYSDTVFSTLTDNNIDIGVKKLALVDNANVSKNIYVANAGAVASATLGYDSSTNMYSMTNVGDIANSTSKIVTTEFDFIENHLYSCDFQFTVPETNTSGAFGVSLSDGTNANWVIYGMKYDGTGVHFGNSASVFGNFAIRDWKSLLNDAYKPVRGVIYSCRPIGNNKIEVYLNGFYLQTITVPFTFTKVGFGMLTISATGQGLQNTQWGRIVHGECKKANLGNILRLAIFGDSITFGEGSMISWADYLPKLLNGQKGISQAIVSNYASSGNRSAEQLTKMQATSLASFDVVCILIGTNDVQTGVTLDTFKTNLQAMITLAKSTYRKVIIGIPPMWISKDLTGVGATTSVYERGAGYRSIIMQLVATNDIYVADTFSEVGRIGTDNVLYTLRDNLHPNAYGETLISRCFARSVLSAITEDS